MPDTFRRPDILTRHATDTERIRKLEVMAQTLAAPPPGWQAREELDDIATQIVMGQAAHYWAGTMTADQAPHATWMIDRAAQAGLEELWQDGYVSEQRAIEWTGLLRGAGAINNSKVDGSGFPSRTMSAGLPTAEEGMPPPVGAGVYDAVNQGDRAPHGKLQIWGGNVNEGEYGWTPEGFQLGSVFEGDPTVPAGDPLEVDGHTIWDAGGWLLSHPGSTNFNWGTSGDDAEYFLFEIEGVPLYAPCNAGSYPYQLTTGVGEQLGPWLAPWACPDNLVDHSADKGGTWMVALFNPDKAIYLACPPLPYLGESVSRALPSGDMPSSYYELRGRVSTMLPSFPTVSSWISQVAQRVNTPDRHRWHTVLRSPGHRGRVEARVQDRHVLLRGNLRLYGPVGTDGWLACIDSRFVPPPATVPFHLGAHTTDGRSIVLRIERPPGSGFPNDYMIAYVAIDPPEPDETSVITVIFDGLTYPTDY